MKKTVQKIIVLVVLLCSKSIFAQVGINTTVPLSTLDINGNLTLKEVGIVNSNVSGSATFLGGTNASPAVINDGIYISLTPSGVNNSFTLPNAVNVPGRVYILRNISGSEDVLLYSSGGLFFAKNSKDPSAAPIVMPFNANLKTLILISDGINWTYIF
jgi:hypothetical protein